MRRMGGVWCEEGGRSVVWDDKRKGKENNMVAVEGESMSKEIG